MFIIRFTNFHVHVECKFEIKVETHKVVTFNKIAHTIEINIFNEAVSINGYCRLGQGL